MTEYAGIKGTKVKYLTSDPTLTSDYEGQVWYNSTTGVNKSLVQIKSFSTGGALPATRSGSGGCGTQGAALNVGGEDGANLFNTTEEYNGFAWSAGGTLNDGPGSFFNPIVGIETAAMRAGGVLAPYPTETSAVENYNGTSWTTGTDLPANNYHGNLAGTQTAAILAGGSPGTVATTLYWNNTSWTAVNSLLEAKSNGAVAGLFTAMLASGGSDGSPGTGGFTDNVQSWDGTNWSAAEDLPTAKTNLRGWGSSTDAIVVGGRTRAPAASATSEQYDGTGWTASASLGSAAYLGSTAGGTAGSTLGIYAGGGRVNASTPTEEYRSTINTVVKAAWASGGTIPDSKRDGYVGSIGTLTAGLAFGGEPINAETYEYDGSSWSSGGDLGTGRRTAAGFGIQTAAGAAGGNASVGFSAVGNFESYDGSSWSEGPDLSTHRDGASGAGTTSAGLATGGRGPSTPTVNTATEEYNGSSWASGGALPAAKGYHNGAGTQTAAIVTGGVTSFSAPYGITSTTFNYNGSAWTSGSNLNLGRALLGAAGTQTAFMAIGGDTNIAPHSTQVVCEQFNGTAFVATAPLSTVGQNFRGTGGTTSAAYEAGGFGPGGSNVATTEEFTGETETITSQTLTTS
jgi:hypothetical protein